MSFDDKRAAVVVRVNSRCPGCGRIGTVRYHPAEGVCWWTSARTGRTVVVTGVPILYCNAPGCGFAEPHPRVRTSLLVQARLAEGGDAVRPFDPGVPLGG